jgi:endonuclease/exonuclease/phosphatase family metal-dependent hydrolase
VKDQQLQRPVRQINSLTSGVAGLWTSSILVIGTSGCASLRPATLIIQNQAVAESTRRTEKELSLKLVTYNVWGLPSWMTGARSDRYPQIARELERLDPDIILLQEAWTSKARKSAPNNGRWAIARAAGQHVFFQQSGLVTLSKFPIINGKFYPFSRAAFPDRFVNKGVLKVTLRLPNGPVLNVWNVHLQDGGPPEVRRCQVRELVSRVQSAEDGQIADLVGGDFNCTPQSTLYRELETTLGASVQHLGGNEPFVTWDGLSAKPNAGQTLDYIFIRNRASFQSVQASQRVAFAVANQQQRLSDHLGIEAVVNLTQSVDVAAAIGSRRNVIPGQSLSDGRAVIAGRE